MNINFKRSLALFSTLLIFYFGLSCNQKSPTDHDSENRDIPSQPSVDYFSFDIGNKWSYDVNGWSGDSYSFSFEGIEDWEILETSRNDTTHLKTTLNGIRISHGWGSPDTSRVANQSDTLNIIIDNGRIKLVNDDYSTQTLSSLGFLLRETYSISENGININHPLNESGFVELEEKKPDFAGLSMDLKYTLQYNVGIKSIYYHMRNDSWTNHIEFTLIDE